MPDRGVFAVAFAPGGNCWPRIDVVDLRSRPFDSGLCDVLIEALEHTRDRSEQALLFINRHGYAPILVCHACGWTAECRLWLDYGTCSPRFEKRQPDPARSVAN